MNYPIWVVPVFGGGWIIGIIAIVHVFLSHFAVGGGAFLALTEELAYRRKDENLYSYLRQHSRFFMLLTSVAGAVTGVGIWWAISLVNPDGTAVLIQNFTLGWAVEYVFFVAELATVFAYYYTWDKLTKEQHLNLARMYFGFSVMTLVVINGILTFMLTPGHWLQSRYWLEGFFNATYWPSLVLRLLIMFALAGMYAMVTSSQIKDQKTREYVVRFCAKWLLPIFFIGPIAGFFYLKNVPQAAIETVFNGVHASGVGNFSILARALYLSLILSGTVIVFAYIGPYLNPRGLTVRISILFLICGLTVTGITEWMRELLRKPYVVYEYMYCNGIRKESVDKLNEGGFLAQSKWSTITALPHGQNDIELGRNIFRYQCMSCHTENGYRGMKKLLGERDRDAIEGFLKTLKNRNKDENPYLGIMPPLVGNDDDLQKLATYLSTVNRPTETKPSVSSNLGGSAQF